MEASNRNQECQGPSFPPCKCTSYLKPTMTAHCLYQSQINSTEYLWPCMTLNMSLTTTFSSPPTTITQSFLVWLLTTSSASHYAKWSLECWATVFLLVCQSPKLAMTTEIWRSAILGYKLIYKAAGLSSTTGPSFEISSPPRIHFWSLYLFKDWYSTLHQFY